MEKDACKYAKFKVLLQYILLWLLWLVVATLTSVAIIWTITTVCGSENDIVDVGVKAGFVTWIFTLAVFIAKMLKKKNEETEESFDVQI